MDIGTIHIEPLDIDGAEYCIKRLVGLNTEDVAKDEKSKDIIDDCVRNVEQYLTSIVERQKLINERIENAYKQMCSYSCAGVQINDDGTVTHLHSDEYKN